jgi:YVTN family beta-propeller protein
MDQPFALAAGTIRVGEVAMKLRICGLIATFAIAGLLGSAQSLAQNAYITNFSGNSVSVIATATNAVTKITDPSFNGPDGVAVTPDGSKVYVTNNSGNSVSVIATVTNAVTKITDPSFNGPRGVAVTPDASKVYVANQTSMPRNSVSVIAAATNAVTKITDPSFSQPVGISIIRPIFAGTPQFSNCHGTSVAALAQKYDGLSAAAAALTFPSVKALQDAITAFCGG